MMKHIKDEIVVNAVKMLKHEIAVHVKKHIFSKKEIQQTYSALTCIECKKLYSRVNSTNIL